MPTLRWYIKSERFLYLLGTAALSTEPWITWHYRDMCFLRHQGCGVRERELWGVKYNIPAGGVLCLPMLLCSGSRQSIKGIEAVRMSTSPSQSHTTPAAVLNDSHLHHLPCLLQVYFGPGQVTLFHCTKEWGMMLHTCPNHFVDGDTGRFQFLGEFVYGLTRVFVGVWVHVGLDARQSHWKSNKINKTEQNANASLWV